MGWKARHLASQEKVGIYRARHWLSSVHYTYISYTVIWSKQEREPFHVSTMGIHTFNIKNNSGVCLLHLSPVISQSAFTTLIQPYKKRAEENHIFLYSLKASSWSSSSSSSSPPPPTSHYTITRIKKSTAAAGRQAGKAAWQKRMSHHFFLFYFSFLLRHSRLSRFFLEKGVDNTCPRYNPEKKI